MIRNTIASVRNTIAKPRVRNSLLVVSVFGMLASLITMLSAFASTPDDSVDQLALACMGIFLVSLAVFFVAAITEAVQKNTDKTGSLGTAKAHYPIPVLVVLLMCVSYIATAVTFAAAMYDTAYASMYATLCLFSLAVYVAAKRLRKNIAKEVSLGSCLDGEPGSSIDGVMGRCDGRPLLKLTTYDDARRLSMYYAYLREREKVEATASHSGPVTLVDGSITFLSQSMDENGLVTESVSLTPKSLGEEPLVLETSGPDSGAGLITEKR